MFEALQTSRVPVSTLTSSAWLRGAVAAVSCVVASVAFAQPAGKPQKQTISYVIANWDTAVYQTKFMDECPEGAPIGNDELWWRGLSRADRDKMTNKGLVQPVDRKNFAVLRGPKGEDVCWNPTIVKDPPLRTIKGKTAYGFNLDGSSDGSATPKSCKHENFTSEKGEPGVDNQLYRVLGCHYGWRRNGVLDTFGNEERRNSGRGVILIEITGVDDPQNSENVEVGFYRALDPFTIDSAGRILPYASYRVDMGTNGEPRYGAIAKGKIKNGVLTTEAVDMKLPLYGNGSYAEVAFRDAKIELDLALGADNKVRGLIGGYYDFDKWWEYMLKVEFLIATGDWSCPALYTAAKEMADGYPDPTTGECTAISSAFKIDALPAFVLHEKNTAANP